jgi:hypothetical protein
MANDCNDGTNSKWHANLILAFFFKEPTEEEKIYLYITQEKATV